MANDDKPILKIVEGAKKPRGKQSEAELKRFGSYSIDGGAFCQNKATRDGEVNIPLCNFTCKIMEEISHDDGLEDKAILRIAGNRQDGLILPDVEVPATKFFSASSNWFNDAWGTRVLVYSGSQKKDNLRAAIQMYSTLNGDIPIRRVYGFTGWKNIQGEWHYLTGNGAITAKGFSDAVQVDLGQGHMSRYQLPAPDKTTLSGLAPVVSDFLKICPGKPYIGGVLLSAVARAPLGECRPIDFSLFIHGLTGAKKSALAAIALGFFGDFTGRAFPANWSDTINDIEAKGFAVKDAVFVVDDFKPSINVMEANKLHQMAERFVRNTGNQAGRGRRSADMQTRPAPFNRSMTLITGEDLPKGQSLLGRLLVMELRRDDVDLTKLTRLQHSAAAGQLRQLMAGFIQYLASDINDLKDRFAAQVNLMRDSAIQKGFASSHPRAPEIYANLVVSAEIFTDFLNDAGVFTQTESGQLFETIDDSLLEIFSKQSDYQIEQDEVNRFFELLRAVLISGNGHIADRINQGPPETRPHAWGWRTDDSNIERQYKPMGDLLGWYCDKEREIWLDKQSSFAAVQQLARKQGDAFLISPNSLWRRMNERQLLLKVETTKNRSRLDVKRIIGGRQCRVLILSADLVESGE